MTWIVAKMLVCTGRRIICPVCGVAQWEQREAAFSAPVVAPHGPKGSGTICPGSLGECAHLPDVRP